MNSQLSFIHAQSRQQDLMRAAEQAHLAAGVEHEGVLSKGTRLFKRFRWTRHSAQSAPAAHARVTVA